MFRPREDVVMIECVMLCVGRCKRGAVERRSWLGLGGVGIVVASGVAAYGLCSGFGEMQTRGRGRPSWTRRERESDGDAFGCRVYTSRLGCPVLMYVGTRWDAYGRVLLGCVGFMQGQAMHICAACGVDCFAAAIAPTSSWCEAWVCRLKRRGTGYRSRSILRIYI